MPLMPFIVDSALIISCLRRRTFAPCCRVLLLPRPLRFIAGAQPFRQRRRQRQIDYSFDHFRAGYSFNDFRMPP